MVESIKDKQKQNQVNEYQPQLNYQNDKFCRSKV